MDIEYDLFKAESNLKKHGVTFEEAASAFGDLNALAKEDIFYQHDRSEICWLLLAMSAKANLLTIVYTITLENNIRIISARKATKLEAKCYA